MVLMNDQARDTLDPGDQAALLGHAAGALAGDHPARVDVELPTGARRADALPPPAREGQAAARWRRGACEADRASHRAVDRRSDRP